MRSPLENRDELIETEIIISERELNRKRIITVEEIKKLIDTYEYGTRWRLCFLIMACCGLRSGEICSLTVDSIQKDFTELRYRVNKYKQRGMKDGKLLRIYKVRTAKIPEFLGKELKYYCALNYLTFKNRKLFVGVDTAALRKQLSKKRKELGGPFLDVSYQTSYGNVKNFYRISCHSFRRFYLTYQYLVNSILYNPALALTITAKEIGHTKIDTTMIYTHRPEDIGVENFETVRTFEQLFGELHPGQMTLSKFVDEEVTTLGPDIYLVGSREYRREYRREYCQRPEVKDCIGGEKDGSRIHIGV